MQVSFSSAYLRLSDRQTRTAGEALRTGDAQRFADMSGATPITPESAPPLLQGKIESLRDLPATYVEGKRKVLQGLQSIKGEMDKSVAAV